MVDSMKKLWAWDSANSKWVQILVDSNGRLSVDVNSTALPTGASTSAKQDTQITALEKIDDLQNALGSVNTDDLKVDVKDIIDGEIKLYGHDGTDWQKLGLIFNYNDVYQEHLTNLSASVGTNTIGGGLVPSGEIWIIENILAYNNTTNFSLLRFILNNGSISSEIYSIVNPLVSVRYNWVGSIKLKEGSKIDCYYSGCTAGDDLYLDLIGYKMKIS